MILYSLHLKQWSRYCDMTLTVIER